MSVSDRYVKSVSRRSRLIVLSERARHQGRGFSLRGEIVHHLQADYHPLIIRLTITVSRGPSSVSAAFVKSSAERCCIKAPVISLQDRLRLSCRGHAPWNRIPPRWRPADHGSALGLDPGLVFGVGRELQAGGQRDSLCQQSGTLSQPPGDVSLLHPARLQTGQGQCWTIGVL